MESMRGLAPMTAMEAGRKMPSSPGAAGSGAGGTCGIFAVMCASSTSRLERIAAVERGESPLEERGQALGSIGMLEHGHEVRLQLPAGEVVVRAAGKIALEAAIDEEIG